MPDCCCFRSFRGCSYSKEVLYGAAGVSCVIGGIVLTNAGKSLIFKLCIALHDCCMLPDFITRMGCRYLIGEDKQSQLQLSLGETLPMKREFIADLRTRNIAEQTSEANEQHYEVDTRFFNLVLGERQKYSSCLYPENVSRGDASKLLNDAEISMLQMYAQRAHIETESTLRIMDVGCGWGCLTLWLAETFPKCTVVGLSNSRTQREYILTEASHRGLHNVEVLTCDISTAEFDSSLLGTFDRLLSIEMFEHMKNYEKLLHKLSGLLKPSGLLFVHIFVSRWLPSHYEVTSEKDWMTKYFFAGGTLPSDDLLLHFQRDFVLRDQWAVNGKHYSLTLEAWLQRMDAHRNKVKELFAEYYGKNNVIKWFARWRTFFISCSEFFSYNDGGEYFVSHYLFEKR